MSTTVNEIEGVELKPKVKLSDLINLDHEVKIEDIQIGRRFKLLVDLYPCDIDKLVSENVNQNAFNGNLYAQYTVEDIDHILDNIKNLLIQEDNVKAGSIIEIKYFELDRNEVYIEFYEVQNDGDGDYIMEEDFKAFPFIRLDVLERVEVKS